jgi:F-box-like
MFQFNWFRSFAVLSFVFSITVQPPAFAGIDELSDEVLCLIFDQLPSSAWKNSPLVCRRWNQVESDHLVWKRRLSEIDLFQLIRMHRLAQTKEAVPQEKINYLTSGIQSRLDTLPHEQTPTGARFGRVVDSQTWVGPVVDQGNVPVLIWSDVARDASGAVREMSYEGATRHCEGVNARLPDLREILQLRISFGEDDALLELDQYSSDFQTFLSSVVGHDFWTSHFLASSQYAQSFRGFTKESFYIPIKGEKAVLCVR